MIFSIPSLPYSNILVTWDISFFLDVAKWNVKHTLRILTLVIRSKGREKENNQYAFLIPSLLYSNTLATCEVGFFSDVAKWNIEQTLRILILVIKCKRREIDNNQYDFYDYLSSLL